MLKIISFFSLIWNSDVSKNWKDFEIFCCHSFPGNTSALRRQIKKKKSLHSLQSVLSHSRMVDWFKHKLRKSIEFLHSFCSFLWGGLYSLNLQLIEAELIHWNARKINYSISRVQVYFQFSNLINPIAIIEKI